MLDLVYETLTSPSRALRRVTEERSFLKVMFLVLLALLSQTVGSLFKQELNLPTVQISLTIGLLAKFITLLLIWFIGAAILHFVAEAWGGEGTSLNLFITLGVSFIPQIFIAPITILSSVFGDLEVLIYDTFWLVIFIWSIWLVLLALKETYLFSSGQALVTLVTSVGLGVIVLGVLVILYAVVLSLLISANFL